MVRTDEENQEDIDKGALASEKKTRGRFFFFKAISAGLTNLPNQKFHD